MVESRYSKRAAKLEKRVGYVFRNKALLDEALTHASAARSDKPHNERLEFLGDRVLGLTVAEELLRRFPDSDEGGIAKRLNELVRKETCADVARKIDLGEAIEMDAAEAKSGGRQKKAMLGNGCEALLAAIYLDGGLESARQFVLTNWEPFFEDLSVPIPEAKTALQEWSHQELKDTPTYETIGREGPDHEPTFVVAVSVGGLKPQKGRGGSKREAERSAARAMLIREGVWIENDA